MDYLQYETKKEDLKLNMKDVLNLIINGLPSIPKKRNVFNLLNSEF